jgi:thioredoxin-like negative regulator of GroEL
MEKLVTADFPEKTKNLCIVKYGTDWCGPCRIAKNILKQIEQESGIPAFEVNIENEKEKELFTAFKSKKIPVVVLYKDTLPVYTFDQNTSKHQYLELIERHRDGFNSEKISG